MSRHWDREFFRAILGAAATATERCAVECGHHAGHHGPYRMHSESAKRATELCRTELKNITG